MVLSGLLPEQNRTRDDRLRVLERQAEKAKQLSQRGVCVAIYGASADFGELEVADRVLTIGAGIRDYDDPDKGYSTFNLNGIPGVDIPLLGSVMGDSQRQRVTYLDKYFSASD